MSTLHLNFEEFCLPNRSDLLGLAVNLTKNKADAEDLLQQTFQLALAGWSSFNATENIALHARAWLFCILRNCFTSNYRRAKNKKRYQETMHSLILEGTFGKREEDEVQPPLEREYVEIDDVVKTAFDLLPIPQRDVMRRFADGEKYHEIASSLDIPIGTVMSRLFRARKALAISLRDYAREEYGFAENVSTVKMPVIRRLEKNKYNVGRSELKVKAAESPKTKADRIKSIVRSDYDGPLFVR